MSLLWCVWHIRQVVGICFLDNNFGLSQRISFIMWYILQQSLTDKWFFSGGSVFLFNRKVLRYFRKDAHNWRKKKDGKTVKEAHEKLKVRLKQGFCSSQWMNVTGHCMRIIFIDTAPACIANRVLRRKLL